MPSSDARVIDTGLTGPVNKEILDSVMGQLSDGKWENTPMMAKYWRNVEIREQDGKLVIVVKDSWDSGFRGKDDVWIRSWFAGKIKEIVYDEKEGQRWDRKDTTVLDYLGGHGDTKVTVSDAYKAYEILKGRQLKNKYAAPSAPTAPATPAQAVEALLSESSIPSVEELFRIFKQVNLDCLASGESVVDFTDTEFYGHQIHAMWEDNNPTDEEVEAAANSLRDYAKAQGYVLPTKQSGMKVGDVNAEGTLRMTQGPFASQDDVPNQRHEVIFQAGPGKFFAAVPVKK